VLDIKELGLFDQDKVEAAVVKGLKSIYPIETEARTLTVDSVDFGKPKYDPSDWSDIGQAIIQKESIDIPVNAKFTLSDNLTGAKISSHKINVGNLPVMTQMGTYIVKGNQYNLPTQLRLKAGGYSRISDKGEAEVFNNIKNGSPMRTQIDPEKGLIKLKIGQGSMPIYPLLKTLGMGDRIIKKTLGDNLFKSNSAVNYDNTIKKIYKSIFKETMGNLGEAEDDIREHFAELETDASVNKKTLKKGFTHVDAEYLLATAKKVVNITNHSEQPDNRDSLEYKDAFGVEETIEDKLINYGKSYAAKATTIRNMDKHDAIGKIVDKKGLNKQLQEIFTTSALSRFAAQANPVAILNAPLMTTLLGEGGIGSITSVPGEAKTLQNSHMGFMDASHTPESSKAGVTLTMSLNTRKRGRDIETRVINLATNKPEWKSAKALSKEKLAFPKEFLFNNGEWKASDGRVTVIENDHIKTTPKSEVKYMLESPSGMFDLATNLTPFVHSNQGIRIMTGSKMAEQAVGLKNPELPLVEVMADGKSLLESIGENFSIKADYPGEVTKITNKYIIISTPTGKLKHSLFANIPLNDHAVIESRVKVKVGDKVKKGQLLADSTFTKDGKYADGVNLTTAYIPWKGYNYEDGQVITEGAAKKLTSIHMHEKKSISSETDVRDIVKYKAFNPYGIKASDMYKYDADGVIKKGTKIKKDDLIVASMKQNTPTGADTLIAKLKKTRVNKYKDTSIKWNNNFEGEVTDVFRGKKGVSVYVKTNEPFQVGDKLANRHGHKGIVGLIIPDELAPYTEAGEKIELIIAPESVPPRINVGQLIETGAGKLAAKTGKTFTVENYSGEDYASSILNKMKELGIKEKENIIDPATGTKIPNIFIGKQYVHKLKQQIDVGVSARGISEAYTSDNQPTTGKGTGGQAIDRLTSNAILAYNARSLMKEISNIKNNSNDGYWRAIQHGELPPAPTTSFEWRKFKGLLQSMGINTKSKGDAIKLSPLTDKNIDDMSAGEIVNPTKTFIGKGLDLTPDKDGLFGDATGGLRGEKFNHIKLNSRIPSPAYKSAIKSVLHLTEQDFQDLIGK